MGPGAGWSVLAAGKSRETEPSDGIDSVGGRHWSDCWRNGKRNEKPRSWLSAFAFGRRETRRTQPSKLRIFSSDVPRKMSRCDGRCCKKFAIRQSPEQVAWNAIAASQGKMAEWSDGSKTRPEPDAEQMNQMLVPLDEKTEPGYWLYTCKNWGKKSGLCKIYETRPEMCRGYGVSYPCNHHGCTMTEALRGKPSEMKKVNASSRC